MAQLRPAVRLWRIEHVADGIGPFQAVGLDDRPRPALPVSVDWDYNSGDPPPKNPHAMPVPEEERVLRRGVLNQWNRHRAYSRLEEARYKFAFPTLRALRYWFRGWALRDLTRLGYVVKVVQVPWEAHTRYTSQVRYDSTRAQVLREIAPVDLFWVPEARPCGRAISALL